MTIKKTSIIASLCFGAGVVSLFAAAADPDTILQAIVAEIFSPIYKAVVGFASIYFFYGVVKYIHDMRNPEDKNTGKNHLLWGSVGLLIILSAGGILSLFADMFGQLGFN